MSCSAKESQARLTRAEQSFRSGDYAAARRDYELLAGGPHALQSEFRLGLIDLTQGRVQAGLERIANLTQPAADPVTGVPLAEQWAGVLLALIGSRLMDPANEALQKYLPLKDTVYLRRMEWLLGVLTGQQPGNQISFQQLESLEDSEQHSFAALQPLSFDEFFSLVSAVVRGGGMPELVNPLCNAALLLRESGSIRSTSTPIERIGSEYGGWYIPEGQLSPGSICYCAGVGEDISFDTGVIEKYGCSVFGLDPTPRAKEHVQQHGPQDGSYTFLDVGLWDVDEEMTFFPPADPSHVSHSIHNVQQTTGGFKAMVKRLSTIMSELAHDRVDLLKMDIEGAEYPVVRTIIEDKLDIGILCIEYHDIPDKPDERYRSIRALMDAGYQLIQIEQDNYSFVSVR